MFLDVSLEVSLVRVINQEPALVEGEVPLAEAVSALVLLAHVAHDQRLQGGRGAERLQGSPLLGVASDNVTFGGHDCWARRRHPVRKKSIKSSKVAVYVFPARFCRQRLGACACLWRMWGLVVGDPFPLEVE